MAEPYFFGYGSLVNLATHSYPDPQPARLRGWRRAWRQTEEREVTFLTVIPDPDCEIEGMIAHVPGQDWAALDAREYAYDRLPASEAVLHPIERDLEIAVYVVPQTAWSADRRDYPILMSYLDVVVQGYLQAFGEAGARRFFETTEGWETPIVNDRATPRYPRAQLLSDAEQGFVDDWIGQLGCVILPN